MYEKCKHPVSHLRSARKINRVSHHVRELKAPASRSENRRRDITERKLTGRSDTDSRLKSQLTSDRVALYSSFSVSLPCEKEKLTEQHDTTFALTDRARSTEEHKKRTDRWTDGRARAPVDRILILDLPIFKLDIFLHKELLGSYVVRRLVFPHPEPEP